MLKAESSGCVTMWPVSKCIAVSWTVCCPVDFARSVGRQVYSNFIHTFSEAGFGLLGGGEYCWNEKKTFD